MLLLMKDIYKILKIIQTNMKQTTCCYMIKNHQYLMLYRNKKKDDPNHHKWIGVGGKVEPNETIEECMKREINEETGLQANTLMFRGVVYFTYPNANEKIYLFTCDDFEGNMHESDEGTLQWIAQTDVLNLDLWEGDKVFLRRLLQKDLSLFCYELEYDECGKLIKVSEKEVESYE